MKKIISIIVLVLAILWAITPYATPPIALLVGIGIALSVGNPFPSNSRKASKIFLQVSVVLLGFSMNLATVLKAGASGILFAAVTILLTFALGYFLGNALKIPIRASMLISAGTAICGGSAIAAVGSVINADEAEMSVAIGTVFLLNAVAIFLFPFLGHQFGLSPNQFGTWAGVAIHDISSVVGAAAKFDSSSNAKNVVDSLQIATAVKLSRALWIIPVALVAGVLYAKSKTESESLEAGSKRIQFNIPYFIGFFILAAIARTYIPAVNVEAGHLSALAATGLTVTLLLIGADLSIKALKSVGWRPLAQGVILWVFISTTAFFVITKL